MKYSIFLCLLIFSLGCNPNEEIDPEMSCNVEDPVNDLEWLNELVNDLDANKSGYRVVKLARYDANSYILVQWIWSAHPGSVYDCKGEDITGRSNMSYQDFESRAQILKVLYEKN